MAKTIIYNSASASKVFDTDNIAVDESTGNRYVNDRNSSTIYRIDNSGTIETLLTGYQWNSLKFIGGFLYASQDNTGISKIDLSGIVLNTYSSTSTVFAGGNNQGIGSTQFYNPHGIAVDSNGNVYVSERSWNRIRRFPSNSTSSSTGTVIAGNTGNFGSGSNGSGAAQLDQPQKIFIDSSDNLYIADSQNHRIQKWASGASSGTTVAGGNNQGSGNNQLNGPTGVFVQSGNIYIADTGNNRIQKWVEGNSSGTTVAGGNGSGSGANQFNIPLDVVVDSSGNIYVADKQNFRVQKFSSGSSSSTNGTTVAGGNGSGTSSTQIAPNAINIDSSNNLFVADEGSSPRIQKFSSGSNVGTTIASGLTSIRQIAFDSSKNMYALDNVTVRKYAFNTLSYTLNRTIITSTAGTSGSATNQLPSPKGFHIFNNDESYVADSSNNRIMYWTSSASAGTQIAGSLNAPEDVTVDSSGNLIVCDTANHKVLKYTKTGTNTFNQSPSTIAGGNGSGSALNQLTSPTFVESNSDGSITVLDVGNDRIVKYPSGASASVVLSDSYSNPSDLYVYANGNLLISDIGNDTITLDTGLTTAPTMTITSSDVSSGGTNASASISLTFTSSLATADFTSNDITVSGGSLSSFTASSTTVYTATFTAIGIGSKSISVSANGYTDIAWGNNNSASNTFTYTNAIPPVLSNTSISSNNALANTRAKVGDVITLTFVSDININTPTVAFTSGGQAITNSVSVSGSNTSWSASYTVNSNDTEGAIAISITATSTAGTQASAHTSISSGSVAMDKTNPAFSSISPSASSFITNTNVGYTLSENLSSGTVSYERTGGSSASDVTVNLTGAELNSGVRSSAVLTNAPTLVNNAIYTIKFNGIDLSGNAASEVSVTGVQFNNVPPTILSVTSTTTDGAYNVGDTVNITVNFSEAVTLSGGNLVIELETGSNDRTVTISSISGAVSASGTYVIQSGDTSSDLAVKTISLSAGNLSNAAGLAMSNFGIGNNLSATSAIVIDTTAPVISNTSPINSSTILTKNIGYTLSEQCGSGSVTFTRTGGTADGNSPHTVNLVASELTSGVRSPADLFNNPSLVSGTIYSIAYNVTDLAGNAASAVTNTGITFISDNTSPTLTITSNDVNSGELSNKASIVLIFTVSETTTDFVVGDISVSGGSLSGFTGSGKNYSVTFSPSGNGSKSIAVNAGVLTDASGNNNLAATAFTYTYDGTAPTIAITSSEVSHNGSFGGSEIGLVFTISEATINFEEEDIVVSNGTLSNFSAQSSTIYTATFTSTINGECNINVFADVFTDIAGNFNSGAVFTWTKAGTKPTVSITSSIAKFASTSNTSIPLTFSTSASTSNFVAGDIVVDGGGAVSNFTGSGTSYTALCTPSNTGIQTITVPEDSFTNSDSEGNEEGQFIFTSTTAQVADPSAGLVTNFVKRNVLKATITTENGQSCELTDLNFYYENGVSSADVLPNGTAIDGLEMIGTIIDIELELKDNSTPDVIESVMIGSWNSMGH